MMNPYLELSNGVLSLPRILDAGKITMNDLPGLEKYMINLWLTSKSMNRLITNYEAVYLSNG
jgi:hypothetical protein